YTSANARIGGGSQKARRGRDNRNSHQSSINFAEHEILPPAPRDRRALFNRKDAILVCDGRLIRGEECCRCRVLDLRLLEDRREPRLVVCAIVRAAPRRSGGTQ